MDELQAMFAELGINEPEVGKILESVNNYEKARTAYRNALVAMGRVKDYLSITASTADVPSYGTPSASVQKVWIFDQK